jgi:hypothetical protein
VPEPRFTYPPGRLYALMEAIRNHVTDKIGLCLSAHQIIFWLNNYPQKILSESLDISIGWFKRTSPTKELTETDFIRYSTKVMSNRYQAFLQLEEARLADAKAKWDALPEDEKKQYPRGFEDWDTVGF